ncbi:MAG: sulfur transferase domain-containing protein [Hyphomicrobiaceae bacterium]
MLTPVPITRDFAVTGALSSTDFERAAKHGFKTVVSLLPDGERPDALSSKEAMEAAQAAGMTFAYIPTSTLDIFSNRTVDALQSVLNQTHGPVLAMCASGQRAAIAWAAARARAHPVDAVLDSLSKAGLDFAFLRDELETQAHQGARHTHKERERAMKSCPQPAA